MRYGCCEFDDAKFSLIFVGRGLRELFQEAIVMKKKIKKNTMIIQTSCKLVRTLLHIILNNQPSKILKFFSKHPASLELNYFLSSMIIEIQPESFMMSGYLLSFIYV